jgi:hypothetical protein
MTSNYVRLDTFENFKTQLYGVNASSFDNIALELFQFQAQHNEVYSTYLKHLGVQSSQVTSIWQIPFMPISFFKHHVIKTGAWQAEKIFSSSGTTGLVTSHHHVKDLKFYHTHSKACFEHFFGPLAGFHFFALLPSYLERNDSSLISMLDYFVNESRSHPGFYLYNHAQLLSDIKSLKPENINTMLWGVTFALLDLAEQGADLGNVMIVETGGMKGRRKEMIRSELHETLHKRLKNPKIYSEYGMTELFSQAYTLGSEYFHCPPWMKIIGRDLMDPFQKGLLDQTCGINVIDLANWHSIGFIETEDLGKVYPDGTFEILGRMDNSDVRGCNLMVQ